MARFSKFEPIATKNLSAIRLIGEKSKDVEEKSPSFERRFSKRSHLSLNASTSSCQLKIRKEGSGVQCRVLES